tara:strand:+ start:560 stop:676 length:117 start_codon:yes stop_codon:yes gene_type:complete
MVLSILDGNTLQLKIIWYDVHIVKNKTLVVVVGFSKNK